MVFITDIQLVTFSAFELYQNWNEK